MVTRCRNRRLPGSRIHPLNCARSRSRGRDTVRVGVPPHRGGRGDLEERGAGLITSCRRLLPSTSSCHAQVPRPGPDHHWVVCAASKLCSAVAALAPLEVDGEAQADGSVSTVALVNDLTRRRHVGFTRHARLTVADVCLFSRRTRSMPLALEPTDGTAERIMSQHA